MSNRIFVATRKGLFTLSRSGRNGSPWEIARTAFLGDNLSIVLADPRDGWVYAGLDLGHFGVKVHRSSNGGETWEECAAPVYPERPEGEPEQRSPVGDAIIPWNLKLIWELQPGGAGEDGVIWCGTVPGGLFRSKDRAQSWEFIRTLWDEPKRKEWFGGGMELPGIHSICVDPRDSKRVFVGVSCGGVWYTPDAGQTWSCRAQGMRAAYMPPERQFDPNIQDPHRVVQCPSDPNALWAQHHNGIFRSADGAMSWHEIESAKPSNFGFGVVVHPQDPDTAWFVPGIKDEKRIPVDAQVVVSRTRDGGRTFDVLREGLPQSHAYDLVFRHALDIDSTGDVLAFGSTTGSLWVSEDQGDSWHTVSNHLPPIHCVRFG